MIDDIPALLSYVEDEILKAHNKANREQQTWHITLQYRCRESAFNDMRTKILNNPVERDEQIPEWVTEHMGDRK